MLSLKRTNNRQHPRTALAARLLAVFRRVRLTSFEGLTHLSVTYPYSIRRDKVARVMTQFHYRLRTGSAEAVWRTEDGVGFESGPQYETSRNDVLAGVARGTIVATPLHEGEAFEVGVDLTLSWMSVLVPGAGAIFFWSALRIQGAPVMTIGSYLAVLIGPIVVHALMRIQVKRAWQDWLEEGIDDAFDTARQRYVARRERR